MHVPDYADFLHFSASGNAVPVYREILADLETPVSAFLKLDDGGDAFLLESVEGGEKWGRYSFLGVAPRGVFVSRGHEVEYREASGELRRRAVADPFAALRDVLGSHRPVPVPGVPRFSGGLVGYLAYDVARFFERLPVRARDDLQLPEQYLLLVDTLLIFDNAVKKIKVLTHV